MSAATEILDFLYLSSYREMLTERSRGTFGVTHILNVKEGIRFEEDSAVEVLHIPLSDYGETDLRRVFPDCFAFIERAREAGGKILVHCRSGQNRSTTVVVGYLTFVRGMTLRESWEHVSTRRPFVTIAEPYWAQLEALEKALKNESTFSYDILKAQLLEALGRFEK
ncbi:MAG: dual specificity protein phosphatase [Bdellovibrionota bacterium]